MGLSHEVTSFARTGSKGRKWAGLEVGAELEDRGWVLDPRGGASQRSSDFRRALTSRGPRALEAKSGV